METIDFTRIRRDNIILEYQTERILFFDPTQASVQGPMMGLNILVCQQYGVSEAMFIHRLHDMIHSDNYERIGIKDGRLWCRLSLDVWEAEMYGLFTMYKTRECLRKLRHLGVFKVTQETGSLDQTQWYTIDYELIEGQTKILTREETPNVYI